MFSSSIRGRSLLKMILAAFFFAAVLIPFLFMGFTLNNMYVISVSKIKTQPNQTIVVGDKEDIYFKNLSSNKLSVSYNEHAKPASWRLEEPAYLKINDSTINKYRINDDSKIVALKKEGRAYFFNATLLKNLFNQGKYKYISCRDYFDIAHSADNFTKNLISIIAKEDDSISVIILDSIPVSIDNGADIYPVVAGNLSGDKKQYKFSFFRVNRTEFYDSIQKNEYAITLNDTLTARTTVKEKYTDWGATSIFFEDKGVCFNKPVINRILKADINTAENNEVEIRQLNEANFLNKDYYVASFSKRQLSLGKINNGEIISANVENEEFNGQVSYFSPIKVIVRIFIINAISLIMLGLYTLFFRQKIKGYGHSSYFIKQFSIYDNREGYNETQGFEQLIYIVYGALFFLGTMRCFIGYHLNYTSPYYYQYYESSLAISLLVTCATSIFIAFIILLRLRLAKLAITARFICFFIGVPILVAFLYVIWYIKAGFVNIEPYKGINLIFKGENMGVRVNNRQILMLIYLIGWLTAIGFLSYFLSAKWKKIKGHSISALLFFSGLIMIVASFYFDNISSTGALGTLMVLYSFLAFIDQQGNDHFLNSDRIKIFGISILKSAILFWVMFCGFVISYILIKPFDSRVSLTILILLLTIFLVKYWGEKTFYLSKSGFDHKYISLDIYRWKRFKFVCYNTARGFYHILPLLLIGFGLILLIPILNKDSGYVINILLPFAILFVVTSFLYNLNYKTSLGPDFEFSHHSVAKLNRNKSIIVGIVTVILLVLAIGFTKSLHYNPNNRFESRMTAFFSFNEVEEDGTINAEEQAQFFAVLAKNVKGPDNFNKYSFSRILSQPGTGVMHNDLSYPGIVISKMTRFFSVVFAFAYLFILIVLLIWVVKLTIAPNQFYTKGHSALIEPVLTLSGMVRIIAVGMLVGNAIWLLASYYNFVPFTGRLMYGMGQDSVGEVLDTTILFSLLLLTNKRNVK